MYFRPFPSVDYLFGDETVPVNTTNLTAYVDIVDQIKDNSSFYTTHYIQDNERPDTLSFALYGTVDYYWTFFLMNDGLRESGWPLNEYQLEQETNELYPNTCLVSSDLDTLFTQFDVGTRVTLSTGDITRIVDRNLNFGQVFVEGIYSGTITGFVQTGSNITLDVDSYSTQAEAVHHYEDADGEWVDIDPRVAPPAQAIPITFAQEIGRYNENLRQINVLKPDVVESVAREFRRKLRN